MDSLLINPRTRHRLQYFIDHPSHALLLSGPAGSGLQTLALHLYKSLKTAKNDTDGLINIQPNDKNTIPIDEIRSLTHRLKLHNRADSGVAVTVLISSVEAMQIEAQNALLKLLEEPPAGVLFILLTHNNSVVLPTISSRCITVPILPVSLSTAQKYFNDTSEAFSRNYRLSGGQAGLLIALQNIIEHPLVETIQQSKQVLTDTPYSRLKLIDRELKSKQIVNDLLQALYRTCHAAVQNGAAPRRWTHNTRLVVRALKLQDSNIQTKLLLDDLFLHLR